MSEVATSVEQRRHPRAQLQLRARIRWRGPFGMRLETAQTCDVSRDGLLVRRAESCEVGARVWVVCPFQGSSVTVLPETPARVVRVENHADGRYRVGLRLEISPRVEPRASYDERRSAPRSPLALPIFVRAVGTPWPEESMTQDISKSGVRFCTSRIFAQGESVLASIPWSEWSRIGEIPARVVRVSSLADEPGPAPQADPEKGLSGVLTSVAVQWEKPPRF